MAFLTVNLKRCNLYRQAWSLKCMNLHAFFLNHLFFTLALHRHDSSYCMYDYATSVNNHTKQHKLIIVRQRVTVTTIVILVMH